MTREQIVKADEIQKNIKILQSMRNNLEVEFIDHNIRVSKKIKDIPGNTGISPEITNDKNETFQHCLDYINLQFQKMIDSFVLSEQKKLEEL